MNKQCLPPSSLCSRTSNKVSRLGRAVYPRSFAAASLIRKRQSRMASMDGALIIDKPAGWTSHDVVARVRRLLQERRVGHTGTLDPFATGVLVLLIGRATRLAQFLSGLEKEYEAVIRIGYATDTGDITGKPLSNSEVPGANAPLRADANFGEYEIEAALNS